MKGSNRDQPTGSRCSGKRRPPIRAFTQPGEVIRDVRLADGAGLIVTVAAQIRCVATKVAAVGAQCVRRAATLDREVIEEGRQGTLEAVGPRLGQESTSASAVSGRSCASATGP
jgi:hypothetical protein